MNLNDNPYSLKTGEAQLALDVDISLRNVLASRKGFSSAGLAGSISSQTKSPEEVETGEEPLGGPAWVNPSNAKSSNNSYATNTITAPGETSQEIKAKKFGFTLPAGAVPVGLVARVEGKVVLSERFAVTASVAQLLIGGEASGNALNLAAPTSVEAYQSAGGSEVLWGLTPSKAQVEATGFGFQYHVAASKSEPTVGDKSTAVFSVDHLELTVYYLVEGFGSAEAEHARNWYSGSKRRLMLSIDGDIKHLTEGTITELFNGTAGTVWSFEQMEYNSGGYKDSIWMLNGTDEC